MDAALIDGDHNWYTVYHELRLFAEGAKRNGTALPVLVMHDVLVAVRPPRPLLRTRGYSGRIPSALRDAGMKPGQKRLLDAAA